MAAPHKVMVQKQFRCAGAQCQSFRGLGPKGARVGHYVGIVRQVLCRVGNKLFCGCAHDHLADVVYELSL